MKFYIFHYSKVRQLVVSHNDPETCVEWPWSSEQWTILSPNSPLEYKIAKSSDINTIYKPLDPVLHQIRVLRLEPGDLDDELRASLTIASISSEEQPLAYEPVSYCWVDATATSEIVLHDLKFSAPSSAVEALRYLRLSSEPRHLWIDSICINQYDTPERESQVEIIAGTYYCGVQTLVWLGMPDNETESAMNVRQRFEEARSRLDDSLDVFDSIEAIELPHDCDLTPVGSILHRSYFTRLWVYQELLLSEDRQALLADTMFVGTFSSSYARC